MPALLYGPPGTGKTSLVEAAFPDLITVAGDGDTTTGDFVGEYTQKPDGSYEFIYGPLIRAMTEGRVLFIDDATLISPAVLAACYPATDGRREVIVKAHKGERITAEPGFYVIAGHNPGVHGAILTEALSSRFAVQVKVSTDYDLARSLGIDSRAITAARNLATRQASGEIGWAPQLRELLAFATVTRILGLDTALANLAGVAPAEDRDVVASALARMFGRSTRVKGRAVGMAPAARCASAAMACRIRSRPGGVGEVMVVWVRPPALASRRARASRRAAACSSSVGSRVMPGVPPGTPAGSRVKTREAASPRLPAGVLLGLAGPGLAGRERGRRGELGGRGGSHSRGGLAGRWGDRGRRALAGLGGVGFRGGLVGGDAQDAAPAPAQPHHGSRVVIARGVRLPPHLAELAQLLLADRGGDRLGDRPGLGRLKDARVLAGQDQGGGRPGLGRAGGRAGGGGEVADHDLGGAGPQPGPVGGRG